MTLPRSAGILIPLFSIRSPDDFGRGDIGGLPAFGALAAAMGHQLIQFLPLDETAPGEASPYSAMSTLALDPSYISVRDIPGIDVAEIKAARDALLVDDDAPPNLSRLREVKEGFIAAAFHRFEAASDGGLRCAFDEYVASNTDWLDDYALFRVFKNQFRGAAWERWPAAIRAYDEAAVAAARRDFASGIRRVQFGQFLLDRQWLDARQRLRHAGVLVGGDLAFSPSRDSPDVWAHQDWFDPARAVGAPPDAFSEAGQRWDLPMPRWDAMRASGFALLRMRIRAARRRYDFLRVDHVVGLFRTYGYADHDSPGAFDPPQEAAQRAQGEEILRIILDEAGPMQIIAEDLGLIPPFVRETLAALGIPGYKIAFWETRGDGPEAPLVPPADYPELAVATTGTHDTETLVEWWSVIPEADRRRVIAAFQLEEGLWESATLSDAARDQILRAIMASPAHTTIFPIQDLFGWRDRVNVPGTVGGRNWRWRLPFDPAAALEEPQLRAHCDRIRAMAEDSGRLLSKFR